VVGKVLSALKHYSKNLHTKDIKPITSRLVFKRKYGPDGQVNRHKARLVARGFQQEEGIDYEETFAAVVKPALSLRSETG
jgi:hypothetical protein